MWRTAQGARLKAWGKAHGAKHDGRIIYPPFSAMLPALCAMPDINALLSALCAMRLKSQIQNPKSDESQIEMLSLLSSVI